VADVSGSTRILANTVASYARLFVVAIVGMFGVPIALRTLGPVDYGIFVVIGGVLSLLLYVNSALTNAAQRHIAYSLGEGDIHRVRTWFTTSVAVHLLLAVAVALGGYLGAHWVLFRVLNLPGDRLVTAGWIYGMVVAAFVINCLATPYMALLLAHESIVPIAASSVGGSGVLLGGILALRFLPGDRLLWYAAITAVSQTTMFVGPMIYCIWRYHGSMAMDRAGLSWHRISEFLRYSTWNLFSAVSVVIRTQGPALLLNAFFGPVANAAYGLAAQVQGFGTNLSWGLLNATNSPIIRSHAAGDHRRMTALSNFSNFISFAILWTVFVPVLCNLSFCLKMWLHKVPTNTHAYLFPLLIALLVDQLTCGFTISIQATGKIAVAQVVTGCIYCAPLPIGYMMLRLGSSGPAIVWVGVAFVAGAGCARMSFAARLARIAVSSWLRGVLLPALVCLAGATGAVLPSLLFSEGAFRLATVAILNTLCVLAIIWRWGTPEEQRTRGRVLVLRLTGLRV
jgi:O-antigen/teichoic acid export membrane protein